MERAIEIPRFADRGEIVEILGIQTIVALGPLRVWHCICPPCGTVRVYGRYRNQEHFCPQNAHIPMFFTAPVLVSPPVVVKHAVS